MSNTLKFGVDAYDMLVEAAGSDPSMLYVGVLMWMLRVDGWLWYDLCAQCIVSIAEYPC